MKLIEEDDGDGMVMVGKPTFDYTKINSKKLKILKKYFNWRRVVLINYRVIHV